MSGRLKAALKRYFTENGEQAALAKLSLAVGRDSSTVRRWLRTGRVPSVLQAREIARQCGFSQEDAEAVARESVLLGAKKAS